MKNTTQMLTTLQAKGYTVVANDNEYGACVLRTPEGREIDVFHTELLELIGA